MTSQRETGSARVRAHRLERCARKRRHATWEDARLAGLAAWIENPRPGDANPALPYPCDLAGPVHYHAGHLRFARGTLTVPGPRALPPDRAPAP